MSVNHFVSASCTGETCSMCDAPATHKVGEEIAHDEPPAYMIELSRGRSVPVSRHNFTAYVCCDHFAAIFGRRVPCVAERITD